MLGNNRSCGLYSGVGRYLASRGIGAVLPNYRLSPSVKHPEHVKDVARAFAWTRAHIGAYGGRPDEMFLVGHSAGGHLVSLLATDETYLRAEGLSTADVRGVVSVSGVYLIPPGKTPLALGGPEPGALHVNQLLPIRGDGTCAAPTCLPGVPFPLDIFGPAFGDDPQVRADASPLNHVRPGLPPFLLLYADHDLPWLGDVAALFQQALSEQGNESRLVRIEAQQPQFDHVQRHLPARPGGARDRRVRPRPCRQAVSARVTAVRMGRGTYLSFNPLRISPASRERQRPEKHVILRSLTLSARQSVTVELPSGWPRQRSSR